MTDGQLSLCDHNLAAAMRFEKNDKIFIRLFNFPKLHLVYISRALSVGNIIPAISAPP